MKEFIRTGVDLAKNYFQIHALESEDGRATTRKLGRQAMRKFFPETKPCLVGMEACGSAPLSQTKGLGARTHRDGFTRCARLISPIYIKPYVKRGNNDAADAAAIEPRLHKTRERLDQAADLGVNALRSHLSEFGIVIASESSCQGDRTHRRADRKGERRRDAAGQRQGGFAGSRPAVGRSVFPSPLSTKRSRAPMRKTRSADCWRAFRGSAR